jgi:hypothetical protein
LNGVTYGTMPSESPLVLCWQELGGVGPFGQYRIERICKSSALPVHAKRAVLRNIAIS